MKDVLKWLGAYATVHSRRMHQMSRSNLRIIAAVVVALIVAALLGPLATVVLICVVLFVLPAVNTDVRSEVDREYKNKR
jgi:ABC-type antimicrobial peptide transport system permease subunit